MVEKKLFRENTESVVDYSKIQTIINNWYEIEEYLYSEDTWKALAEEIEKAKLIVKNKKLTKAEVDIFSENLERVFCNLKLREEKEKLAQLVNYADLITDINSVVTVEQRQLRWYNFENIRKLTKETLFDPNNSKADNETAFVRLKFFMEELGVTTI